MAAVAWTGPEERLARPLAFLLSHPSGAPQASHGELAQLSQFAQLTRQSPRPGARGFRAREELPELLRRQPRGPAWQASRNAGPATRRAHAIPPEDADNPWQFHSPLDRMPV